MGLKNSRPNRIEITGEAAANNKYEEEAFLKYKRAQQQPRPQRSIDHVITFTLPVLSI